MASPVATFFSFRLRTMTSIDTQCEFVVVCFDFTIPGRLEVIARSDRLDP
jgi:hypothetical protein